MSSYLADVAAGLQVFVQRRHSPPWGGGVAVLAPITSQEPLVGQDGEQRWIPFLAMRRRLRHPIPLGDEEVLSRRLPTSPQEFRLLEIDRLLVATSLAELISGWEGDEPRPA